MSDNVQKLEREKSEEKQDRGSSVRDAIRAAVEEHSQDDVKKDEREDREDSRVSTELSDDKSRVKSDKDEIGESEDKKSKGSAEADVVETKPEKLRDEDQQREDKTKEDKAPSIVPKEVQNDWANIPLNTKNYITKTQKELADTKAELGRKSQQYREMDAAIAPYAQAINSWGVTPAQTVDRLFQWMHALAGPNKYDAIQQLAYDFGIDLYSLFDQQNQNIQQSQNQTDQNQTQNQNTQNVDPRIASAIEAMYGEVSQLKNNLAAQKQNAAANYVESWAGLQPDGAYKNKPHFPQVRQLMYSLLANGSVPSVNGQLDLDTAYENACYSHPEVRQLLLAQQEQERQNKVEEVRRKKVAEDQTKVAKAKAANFSLKSSSPSSNSTSVDANGRVRDKTGKFVNNSVRDSIYAAIREVNN